MLFKKEDYGRPINEDKLDFIKRNMNPDSIKVVAENSNMSTSTIKGVIYSGNSISKRNSKALNKLARISFKNCLQKRDQADADLEFFAREIEVK